MRENSKDAEAQIKKLKDELKGKQSTIEQLQDRLNNNGNMLQDLIQEKNQLKKRIQEYDLSLIDAKLSQYQKLQEDHQKTVHRLQVTKKHLDELNLRNKDLNKEIEILKEVIEELGNRGLLDLLRGKYPKSFERYKGRKVL